MSGLTFSEAKAMLDEVSRAGFCSHPVRLSGTSVNRHTGELFEGTVTVACRDRRAAVCPACARLYQGDAWHLVVAGLKGGKGVPDSVAVHPRLFVTVTAPSMGPVHSARQGGARCRPRRSAPVCAHGVVLTCKRHHTEAEAVVGEPICPECFDYERAVLWNAHVSRLWQRTTIGIVRALGTPQRLSEAEVRAVTRLSFVKVAEFQRRGLIHLHAVVRADGPDGPDAGPPGWLDAAALADAVTHAVAHTSVAVDARDWRATWGTQLDVHELVATDSVDPEAVAAYVAVYVTKTTDGSVALARPLHSRSAIDRLGLRDHTTRLVTTAWDLGAESALAELRLRAHAHTFGFAGHLTTKSVAYSTTFKSLRQARRDVAGNKSGWEPAEGGWRYLGRGYQHPQGGELADVLGPMRVEVARKAKASEPTGEDQAGSAS